MIPKFDFSDKSISIFGSCVSRDLLELQKEKNFKLVHYFARCSIISAVSEPIEIKEEQIPLKSTFQRKQVFADLKKELWEKLSNKPSDFLMIDLIDERFSIGKYNQSYFTMSNEYLESRCFDEAAVKLEKECGASGWILDEIPLTWFLDQFVQRIGEIYTSSQIILHKAVMVDYYLDSKGNIVKFPKHYLSYNNKINQLLNTIYSYLEKKLKGCIVLDYCKQYCADSNHQWGLAPEHYEDAYYIRILNELYKKIEKRKQG